MSQDEQAEGRELVGEIGIVEMISKAELDQAIATAKRWPRSITKFRREALEMATIDESVASGCIYALKRKEFNPQTGEMEQKIITGPSARLAEIVLSAWGNVRAGARVVDSSGSFVIAQGLFYDCEKNVGITYETQRRITNRSGKRFNDDMISVTANAACSIALRNAVFKGIPKALWASVETEVRRVIAGDAKTLGERVEKVMSALNKMGVPDDMIFAALGIVGKGDIGLDELVLLQGMGNAIKEDGMSIETVFAALDADDNAPAPKSRTEEVRERLKARGVGAAPGVASAPTSGPAPAQSQTPTATEPATSQSTAAQETTQAEGQKSVAAGEGTSTAKSMPADPPAKSTTVVTEPIAQEQQAPPAAEVGPTPKYTAESGEAYIRGAKSAKEFHARWDRVFDDHDFTDRLIPQSLLNAYNELKSTKWAKG